MKQKTTLLFLLAFILFFCSAESQHFYDMSFRQIDQVITDISQKDYTVTERIGYYSELFLGTPYALTCVGDGPYALYEPYPLVNFDSTNCMAYCEHVLALAISDSWDNFFNNLQQIRYQGGLIGMRTRNHYTMGDWLPENSWLLEDVTGKVGAQLTEKTTRTISHREFFKGKGITDLRHVKADYRKTIDYIPSADLAKIEQNLMNGDIGCLIFAGKTDIFSAHMWMVIEKEGEKWIRESTSRGMSTFDTPYDQWSERIGQSPRYAGISLMRVRNELNTPGRIIVPTEIDSLKSVFISGHSGSRL